MSMQINVQQLIVKRNVFVCWEIGKGRRKRWSNRWSIHTCPCY